MEQSGRTGMGWAARLLIGLSLVLAGAAAAAWGLARYQPAARVLGIVPERQQQPARPPVVRIVSPSERSEASEELQIGQLEARLRRLESESREAHGSAGRADALLIAVAARRAVDRGVALGYLEPLLVSRFGTRHPRAVATIVTASRSPVRLSELIAGFQDLRSQLLGPPPNENLWAGVKRGFSSLISVRRSDRPSSQPQARYDRALAHLTAGEVDSALAETMRLPGAPRARDWIFAARQYVAVHRALDEVESAALVGEPAQR